MRWATCGAAALLFTPSGKGSHLSCQDNETAQVAAAVAGDREALARLLVAHSELLTRRLRARVQLNPVVDFSVEDVLQEVFLDVHRGIGTFRTDSGTAFAAWLQKVADNRLAAMLRHRNRVKRGGRRRRVPCFRRHWKVR